MHPRRVEPPRRRAALRRVGAVLLVSLPGSCLLVAPSGEELAAGEAACPDGSKECGGACVPLDDPATGCALWGCEPCSLEHAAARCEATGCAVGICERGWADCDQESDNGCEIALPAGIDRCGCQSIRFVDEFGMAVVDTSPVGPIELGDDFTVEAWVMTPPETPAPQNNALFATSSREGPGAPLPVPLFLLHVSQTTLSCSSYDGAEDATYDFLVVDGVLRPGRWMHVACVSEGDVLVAFVDGREVGRVPFTATGIRLDHPAFGGEHGVALPDLHLGPMRVSRRARYLTDFEPTTHWTVDDDTLLQFLVFSPFDQVTHVLGQMQDEAGTALYAVSQGGIEPGELTPCDEGA